MEITVEQAMDRIKQAMHDDPEYAWTWHCNVAMASVDCGMDHAAANRAAERFMGWAFGVKDYAPASESLCVKCIKHYRDCPIEPIGPVLDCVQYAPKESNP